MGCGTAEMWREHWHLLDGGILLVLSGLSSAFVEEAATRAAGLRDYVFSMTSIAGLKGLDRDALRVCFEKRMDADGVLRMPKEYGMFLCTR